MHQKPKTDYLNIEYNFKQTSYSESLNSDDQQFHQYPQYY